MKLLKSDTKAILKKHKSKFIIILAVIFGILLIVLSGKANTKKEGQNEMSSLEYTQMMEEKIADFLLSIDGINDVKVVVTLDTSSEQVYAQNQTTYDFLTIDSDHGESPVNVTEIYPTVRGVAIACTNGNDDRVKMQLTKLISAYLGISSNRIEIIGIK